jgi:hypothetical protein
VTTAAEVGAKRPRSGDLDGRTKPALLTRRAGKLGFGALMLVLRSSRKIQGIGLRPTRPAVSSRLGVNHLSVSEH